MSPETVIRHAGLAARDQYEFHGHTDPLLITDECTTVRWDSEQDAAVFDLDGVALTVPSAALDDIGLVPADPSAQIQGPASALTNNQEN